MKSKIVFFAQVLDTGGISRACINYINGIDKDKYDVTLFLEKKEGVYLNDVDKNIRIINFNLSDNKNIFLRKIINFSKLVFFGIRYYRHYDFAAHFATCVKSSAILCRLFSKNNAFWFHGEYWDNYQDASTFCETYKVFKYNRLIFVSNHSKELFERIFPDNKQRKIVLNNPINYLDIQKKSKMPLDVIKNKKVLLNVGRHEEYCKNILMLLECVNKLIKKGYDFELWLVGSGEDTEKYKDKVRKYHLEDYVKFFGFSNNVYPYYRLCDATILSSKTEGNPVVFLEAKILNKPVISTDVSDAKIELDGFGIVTKNNQNDYYKGLKLFLDKGYIIKKKFDYVEYNQKVFNKLYNMIEVRDV